MHEAQNNYERIAKIYSPLTKLISFGGNERTQDFFVGEVRSGNKVLVVGCGTVDFPIKLAKIGAQVTCLDISPTMLNILEKKVKKLNLENQIEFVCCNVLDFEKFGFYDFVSTNYFLNVFNYETMNKVFNHVIRFIAPEGKLFLADEVKADMTMMRVVQKIFRPIVYRAHHLFVNNSLHEIYDYVGLLKKHNFNIVKRSIDKSRCMQSIVAVKNKQQGGTVYDS